MAKFTNEDIEELKRYFTLDRPIYNKLPEVKGFKETNQILVKDEKIYILYILINSNWKKLQEIT